MTCAVNFQASNGRELAKILNGLVGGKPWEDECHRENFTVKHLIPFQVIQYGPGAKMDVVALVEAEKAGG